MKSRLFAVSLFLHIVTPLAGVWIEIVIPIMTLQLETLVTPLAGVWIEIHIHTYNLAIAVTPLAGVWIEIPLENVVSVKIMSLPSRECGLK